MQRVLRNQLREPHMPEPLRMFAVQAIQQAERAVYEGRVHRPWENVHRHSLPPPPDKPVKATEMQQKRSTSGTSGRVSPRSAGEMADLRVRVHELTARGLSGPQIADELRCTLGSVHRLRWQNKRTGVPVKEPGLPAPPPPSMPSPTVVAPARTAEPARTHVLDWAARLGRIEFEGEPKARSARKRKSNQKKCVSRADYREVCPTIIMREGGQINARPQTGHAIDCAAPTQATRQDHAEQAKKARKTAELAIFLAGGEAERF